MMLEEDTQSYSPEDNYFFSINCSKRGTQLYTTWNGNRKKRTTSVPSSFKTLLEQQQPRRRVTGRELSRWYFLWRWPSRTSKRHGQELPSEPSYGPFQCWHLWRKKNQWIEDICRRKGLKQTSKQEGERKKKEKRNGKKNGSRQEAGRRGRKWKYIREIEQEEKSERITETERITLKREADRKGKDLSSKQFSLCLPFCRSSFCFLWNVIIIIIYFYSSKTRNERTDTSCNKRDKDRQQRTEDEGRKKKEEDEGRKWRRCTCIENKKRWWWWCFLQPDNCLVLLLQLV